MSRDIAIEVALNHLRDFESSGGKLRGLEKAGGTVGDYHLSATKDAKNLALARSKGFVYTPSDKSQVEQYNEWVLANPSLEKEMARERLAQIFDDKLASYDRLEIGEQVSLLTNLYNVQEQPNLMEAVSKLDGARRRGMSETVIANFKKAARGFIDVTKKTITDEKTGKETEVIESGIMKRTQAQKAVWDGQLNIKDIYYDSKWENLTHEEKMAEHKIILDQQQAGFMLMEEAKADALMYDRLEEARKIQERYGSVNIDEASEKVLPPMPGVLPEPKPQSPLPGVMPEPKPQR